MPNRGRSNKSDYSHLDAILMEPPPGVIVDLETPRIHPVRARLMAYALREALPDELLPHPYELPALDDAA